MRDFSWKYFALTGNVESYLLYKEIDNRRTKKTDQEENAENRELLSNS